MPQSVTWREVGIDTRRAVHWSTSGGTVLFSLDVKLKVVDISPDPLSIAADKKMPNEQRRQILVQVCYRITSEVGAGAVYYVLDLSYIRRNHIYRGGIRPF
jgi:hypothetical protein